MPTKIHEGRNVKRLREIMGIKQEVLADELGWTQQKVSLLEAKENIDANILEQVAQALKVPAEAIKNFNEETAINIFSNTFNSHDNASGPTINSNPTFNPLDKLLEALEENKKLYERLLQTEREKVALLERLLPKQ